MKRIGSLLVVLFVVCCPPVLADGIVVGGRVLVPGGEPLPRADVQLLPAADAASDKRDLIAGEIAEPTARVLTDDDGWFRIAAPSAGLWLVRVEAPGFAPMELRIEPLIEPLELADVTLPADTGVTVRVVDAGGRPVADAVVLVRPETGRFVGLFDRGWQTGLRAGTTDADGAVRPPRAEAEPTTIPASATGSTSPSRRSCRVV